MIDLIIWGGTGQSQYYTRDQVVRFDQDIQIKPDVAITFVIYVNTTSFKPQSVPFSNDLKERGISSIGEKKKKSIFVVS